MMEMKKVTAIPMLRNSDKFKSKTSKENNGSYSSKNNKVNNTENISFS
jgi:hypothetical protein